MICDYRCSPKFQYIKMSFWTSIVMYVLNFIYIVVKIVTYSDLNYCTHHKPCLNGATCTNTGAGHYTCACRLGYTGANCESKIETCELQPCFNGATCRETGTNYTCKCADGYTGKHCQTFAKTCQDNPCENGATCMNVSGSSMAGDSSLNYECVCPPGWQGENCDTETDMCQSSPCENGNSCSILASKLLFTQIN